jgi:hypothetical protein
MPFDNTNYVETRPDTFSLDGLIAWLETQDPETKYNYANCSGGCLIGRYLIATTGKMWHEHGLRWRDICRHHPQLGDAAAGSHHTYGGGLTRAKALRDKAD